MLGSTAIRPDDTVHSLGGAPDDKGEVVVHAVPRDSEEAQHAEQARDAAAAVAAATKATSSTSTTEALAAENAEQKKRPTTAYILWCRVRRPALLEARPALRNESIGEVAKALAAEWRQLSAEERKPFDEQAAEMQRQAPQPRRSSAPTTMAGQQRPTHRRTLSGCSGRKRPRRRGTDEWDSGDESDDCKEAETVDIGGNGDDADADVAPGRRSSRLLESPAQSRVPQDTPLVYHAEPSAKRRRKQLPQPEAVAEAPVSTDVVALNSDCTETGAVAVPATSTNNDRKRDPAEHMTYSEYLSFDREQDRVRGAALRERQQRLLVNGHESDEELQLALALSLSDAKNGS